MWLFNTILTGLTVDMSVHLKVQAERCERYVYVGRGDGDNSQLHLKCLRRMRKEWWGLKGTRSRCESWERDHLAVRRDHLVYAFYIPVGRTGEQLDSVSETQKFEFDPQNPNENAKH